MEDSGISITSVDGMRAWLHRDNGGPSPELVRYKRLVIQARKILDMENVPMWVKTRIGFLLYALRLDSLTNDGPEWNPEQL